ncbi:helix-turn-helix domain-containing protein [Vibrio sp. 1CM2L]|uniref:hypothetical protein n=1 Tax=Vibrio TaxID=662 RepID=UPI0006368340|nr:MULTISPECIES: hypothetical protein [Vibrio]MCK8075162.1 helix-turn-helix domain-containing protein [Vibrio sp. 1CM2L]CDT13656.1 conserved hypothetical protein [Vibrio coralliirubri]CDT14902.1 conserved hypothetical protein [Vibrio coralliirubri]CDT53141.1 conserved hypothetical protein [Vibrio coralliirubri]CDT74482.1 conserved hypothetical protein [Vibrio coralliirubri]
MKLRQYIDEFWGSQRRFAEAQGVKPQQVTQWIKSGYYVVEHELYSRRRELVSPDTSVENS